MAWCVILTLIVIFLIVYIFKSKTTIHSEGETNQNKSMINVTSMSDT